MLVAFRADASSQIGSGHIMRCLALARGLKRKGADCIFITKEYSGNLISHINNEGFKTEVLPAKIDLNQDMELTSELCYLHSTDVIVTDSYDLNGNYLTAIKKKVKLLVSIDDPAQSYFPSDILLNQNFGIKKEDYQGKVTPYTKLLLGSDYILLRDEFREKSRIKREIPPIASRVLVTLGGGDPNNQTLKVLKGLKGLPGLQIKAVLGSGYQYTGKLQGFLEDNTMIVDLIEDSRNMSDLMVWADLAISAAGSTCWELACLGVPCLAIVLADNQKVVVAETEKKGILINLGWHEEVTEEDIRRGFLILCSDHQKRKQMSKKGKQLVDGRGVERVVSEIYGIWRQNQKIEIDSENEDSRYC